MRVLLGPTAPAWANIERNVHQIIKDHMGIEECKNEDNLIDDIGMDSLDTVELVMAIEESFNMEIDDATAEKCKTVGDIIEALRGVDHERS